MGEATAHTRAVGEAAEGGAQRVGLHDSRRRCACGGEIEDRLDARPAERCFEKGLPGEIGETVGIAIAAAEQVDEHIIRQIIDVVLDRTFGNRIEVGPPVWISNSGGNGRQAGGATIRVQALPNVSV